MPAFVHDLRHALRALAKSPGYTAVAVLTLTLGIGGVSAIFSVVDAVLLQPLPYAEPERLMRIAHAHDEDGAVPGHFSPPDFDDLQAATRGVYAPLAAYFFTPGHSGINLTGDGEPQRLEAAFVSTGFFPALGVPAARGRALAAGEVVPGRDRVAVVSDGLWRRRFGADPRLVGRAVTLDGEPFTVVGIMPPAFRFPSREVDVWLPISLIGEDDIPRLRGLRWMSAFGRLAPGVTEDEARAATGAVLARLATENPETNERWRTAEVNGLKEALVADVERALLVLFGAVALVLAIACVNLANLSLARATARRREVAIRAALGAGRGRLLAGSLAESVLLALGGGALALLAASWGVEALVALAGDQLPRPDEVGLDLRVAAFTFLVAALTGFAFGLAPALRAARQDPHLALQEGGARGPRAAGTACAARSSLPRRRSPWCSPPAPASPSRASTGCSTPTPASGPRTCWRCRSPCRTASASVPRRGTPTARGSWRGSPSSPAWWPSAAPRPCRSTAAASPTSSRSPAGWGRTRWCGPSPAPSS